MNQTKKIILASTSDSRRTLLERANVAFEVEPSDYEEDMSLALAPEELVKTFSQGKARAVASKHTGGIIIGADSVAVLDGKIMGKPKDEGEAREFLKSLSSATHTFLTGFTVIDIESGEEVTRTQTSQVTFKKLSEEEINAYIASGEPLQGHAGAYAAQGKGAVLIQSIEGEFTNTFGLPLCSLNEVLQKFGVSLLN